MTNVLFDTNILVYLLDTGSKFHDQTLNLFKRVLNGEWRLFLSVQNLNECHRVITSVSPKKLSAIEALEDISNFENSSVVIYPNVSTFDLHKRLLEKYNVRSYKVYGCFLVATMLSYGVKTIYTNNDADFKIFEEIEVVNPFKKTYGRRSDSRDKR